MSSQEFYCFMVTGMRFPHPHIDARTFYTVTSPQIQYKMDVNVKSLATGIPHPIFPRNHANLILISQSPINHKSQITNHQAFHSASVYLTWPSNLTKSPGSRLRKQLLLLKTMTRRRPSVTVVLLHLSPLFLPQPSPTPHKKILVPPFLPATGSATPLP